MKLNVWITLAALFLATSAVAKPSASDVPPSAVLADLPMLSTLGVPLVVVDLAPKGHRPLRLMIDTGSSHSVMTPGYAHRLGVIVRPTRDFPYERATVVGRRLHFRVDTRLGQFESQAGIDFGLLGTSFIHHYILEMDFGARRVRFIDPRRYAVPASVSAPNEAVLPFHLAGVRPSIPVQVDGKPLRVLLDTGLPVPLVLSGSTARGLGISHPLLAQFELQGYLGPLDADLIEVDRLDVGPFGLALAPIVFLPNGDFNLAGSSHAVLGCAALAQYDVRIDYRHHRLWLRREKNRPPSWLDIFGLRAHHAGVDVTVDDEGILVGTVQPGSPAARLGLRKGDRIPFHGEDSHAQQVAVTLVRIARGEPITVIHDQQGGPVESQLQETSSGPEGP